jgi:Zn-dependent peptidase ImmA (M78 family)
VIPHDEVSRRAGEIRAGLRLGDEPVPEIVNVLEQLGLAVYVRNLGPEGPQGAYLPRPKLKVVLLNSDQNLGRLRFTAAHEIGHFAFDDGAKIDENGFVTSGVHVERRANRFAACFLLPDVGILARTPPRTKLDPSRVVSLASEFGVSYEMMGNRLQQLRLIGAAELTRLMANRSAVLTPEFRDRRLPRTELLPDDYMRRAFEAYFQWRISFTRLAELLRVEDERGAADLVTFLRSKQALHEDDEPEAAPVETRSGAHAAKVV